MGTLLITPSQARGHRNPSQNFCFRVVYFMFVSPREGLRNFLLENSLAKDLGLKIMGTCVGMLMVSCLFTYYLLPEPVQAYLGWDGAFHHFIGLSFFPVIFTLGSAFGLFVLKKSSGNLQGMIRYSDQILAGSIAALYGTLGLLGSALILYGGGITWWESLFAVESYSDHTPLIFMFLGAVGSNAVYLAILNAWVFLFLFNLFAQALRITHLSKNLVFYTAPLLALMVVYLSFSLMTIFL